MAVPWWDSNWEDRSGREYRCYVSNLPYGTSDTDLKNAFAPYRPIFAEVVVNRDTGRSRGFGFVHFGDQKSMDDAIQDMNGQDFGGRRLSVSEAQQRPRRWRA
ncbi:hypothetical protein ACP4OV_009012 [Aristida adscensionis]